MKKKIYIASLSIISFSTLFSCEKDPSGNGSLDITVQYRNQPVPGSKVYLKMGVYTRPNFTDSQYDGILTSDANGTVVFSNLIPGRYYLKAMGSSGNATVQGDTVATVVRGYRGDNISNFTIDVR